MIIDGCWQFWLLQIKLLWTFMYKSFNGDMHFSLLDKYLGWIGWIIYMFNFWRNHQISFQCCWAILYFHKQCMRAPVPSTYSTVSPFNFSYSSREWYYLIGTLVYNSFSPFSSVTQSCPILWDPMNHSTPALPVYRKLPEFTQSHAHRVGDVLQPSHSLSFPSPPAPNPSQHQGLFQWVNSSHQVA